MKDLPSRRVVMTQRYSPGRRVYRPAEDQARGDLGQHRADRDVPDRELRLDRPLGSTQGLEVIVLKTTPVTLDTFETHLRQTCETLPSIWQTVHQRWPTFGQHLTTINQVKTLATSANIGSTLWMF